MFDDAPEFWHIGYLYNFFFVVTLFLKLILGFFQVQSMMELTLRLRQDSGQRLKRLKHAVWTTNGVLTILMLSFAFYFVYPITYKVFKYHNADPYMQHFRRFMTILGVTAGTLYSVLTVLMIVAYVLVYKQLQATLAGHNQMQEVSRNITTLFFITLVAYILRTLFLYGQGQYYRFIKSQFLRLELEMTVWSILDFMTIVPNLILHWRNFRKKDEIMSVKTDEDLLHTGSVGERQHI